MQQDAAETRRRAEALAKGESLSLDGAPPNIDPQLDIDTGQGFSLEALTITAERARQEIAAWPLRKQQAADASFVSRPAEEQLEPEPEQIMQKAPAQPAQRTQRQVSMTNQSKFSPPKPAAKKPQVPWYPRRNNGVSIELTDCVIVNVPEVEADPQGRITQALFAELLNMRDALDEMSGGSDVEARLARLESILSEQKIGMKAKVLAAKDQVLEMQAKGMSPDEIVRMLSSEGV